MSVIDKKPSGEAGSKLKILITLQRGKHIIAHPS